MYKKTENSTRHDVVRTLPRRFLLPECHAVPRYTRKCNVVYAREKSTASSKPIFTKLTVDRECTGLRYGMLYKYEENSVTDTRSQTGVVFA